MEPAPSPASDTSRRGWQALLKQTVRILGSLAFLGIAVAVLSLYQDWISSQSDARDNATMIAALVSGQANSATMIAVLGEQLGVQVRLATLEALVPEATAGPQASAIAEEIGRLRETAQALATSNAQVASVVPELNAELTFDFAAAYCTAEWVTQAGVLRCPGNQADPEGFVLKLDTPQLENGVTELRPALWTHPQLIQHGVIAGTFPPISLQEGDHFTAVIGCLFDALSCNVKFQLNYRAGAGSLQNLEQWNQTYDGNLQWIDVDLSRLAGKSVEFVLAVLANGAPDQDWAIWLAPRIERSPG